jgi:hypothetical protein
MGRRATTRDEIETPEVTARVAADLTDALRPWLWSSAHGTRCSTSKTGSSGAGRRVDHVG